MSRMTWANLVPGVTPFLTEESVKELGLLLEDWPEKDERDYLLGLLDDVRNAHRISVEYMSYPRVVAMADQHFNMSLNELVRVVSGNGVAPVSLRRTMLSHLRMMAVNHRRDMLANLVFAADLDRTGKQARAQDGPAR